MAELEPEQHHHQESQELVTVTQVQVIYFELTKKKWVVPEALLKPIVGQEGEWLQVAAANYGLCNLLSTAKIPGHSSLKASQGLVSLLEMRSTKASCTGSESGNTIFDSEVSTRKSSKRKKSFDDDKMIELDLGKHGPLKVKAARKSSEDLHIAFSTENVKAFLLYMHEIGAEVQTNGRRQYHPSGKYAKKAQ